MPLHTDRRPDGFKDFLGNDRTIKALKTKLESKNPSKCYLITGPSGCGKTTLGRIIARTVKALGKKENPENARNYHELDSADFRGIDTIRDIRKNMGFAPLGGGKTRLWLLDEVHQLTSQAQEALLKALEQPPAHVYFVLATTEPNKLKDTLKRRCIHFKVSPMSEDVMVDFLSSIIEDEGKTVPKKVLEVIAEESQGSPGKALTILDKIIDLPKKEMKLEIESTAKQFNQAIDLCRAIIKKDKWKNIASILNGLKTENPEGLRIMILRYCLVIHCL